VQEREESEFSSEYTDKSFRDKLKAFAVTAGREVVEKSLVLFYCLRDPNTPEWAKSVIIGALGYFIVPVDAIPDLIPAVGYADDLGVLALALSSVLMHITDKHKSLASDNLKEWFGSEDEPH